MSQSNAYGPGAGPDDIPGVNANGDVPAGAPVLFGRQAECEVLDRLVAGARAGRGGALVVRGAPVRGSACCSMGNSVMSIHSFMARSKAGYPRLTNGPSRAI